MLVIATVITVALVGVQNAHAARASCYGPGLFGNQMANGERLTKRTLGIAHRTLPLGTRLVLKHRGKRVTVRVTDRGPYIAGRQLDVTQRVARKLGYRSCSAFGVRTIRSHRAF